MPSYDVHDIDGQPAFDRPAFEKAITGGRKRITIEDWSDLKQKKIFVFAVKEQDFYVGKKLARFC